MSNRANRTKNILLVVLIVAVGVLAYWWGTVQPPPFVPR